MSVDASEESGRDRAVGEVEESGAGEGGEEGLRGRKGGGGGGEERGEGDDLRGALDLAAEAGC